MFISLLFLNDRDCQPAHGYVGGKIRMRMFFCFKVKPQKHMYNFQRFYIVSFSKRSLEFLCSKHVFCDVTTPCRIKHAVLNRCFPLPLYWKQLISFTAIFIRLKKLFYVSGIGRSFAPRLTRKSSTNETLPRWSFSPGSGATSLPSLH